MTNQSKVPVKRNLKAVLAIVVMVLVIIGLFASTAFADGFNQYDVKIIDNAEELFITTNETEPIEILKNAGITLASEDKMDISDFEQGVGGTIEINRFNTINVELDTTVQTYGVYGATVGEALSEIGATVGEQDEINYALTDPVKDGMVITIQTAFSVSLTVDGATEKYAVVRGTVGDILSQAGVTLSGEDYCEPAADTALSTGMAIQVYRVTYSDVTEEESVAYTTSKVNDDTLYEGTTKVETKGVNGTKTVTYKAKYVDGVEESREKVTETVTVQPVNEVVKVGTKKAAGASVTANGVTSMNGYTVGQVISGKYTHYCACATCNGNSNGVTTSGKRISNGMANPYYVACNWLPLGTVICVDGVNYTVVDRGGSGLSKVGRIDIFTPEGHSACYRLGTGSCTIEIVRLGW